MTSNMRENAEKTLEQQLTALREELAHISHTLSQKSSELYDDARHNTEHRLEQLRKQGQLAAREVRHQAKVATDTARENPLTTAAIIAGLGLAVALLIRR